MATEILVRDSKFYNEYKNDVGFVSNLGDYTNNLTGSVMENVKLTQTVDVSWTSSSSASDIFVYDPVNFTMTRQTGNYINDGMAVGDTVDVWYEDSLGAIFGPFPGTIASLSEKVMVFTANIGIAASGYGIMNIHGTTWLTASVYKFGLIENNGNFNVTSKVSGNDQGYYGSSIGFDTGGGVRDTNFVTLQRLGQYEDWRTGLMKIRYVSNPTTYVQRFEIEHEFTLVPYYLDGELSNLEDNVTPDLLAGLNSLKYVYSPGFRTVLSNPNTEKVVTYEDTLGSVAWFNENFNGFNNNYQVDSITYEDEPTTDSADGLLISGKTKVTINVTDLVGTFSVGERAGVYVSYLPSQTEYQDTTLTNLKQNFIYDNAVNNKGLAGVAGQDFITNFEIATGTGADKMVLTFEVEYSSLQKAFLANKNNNEDIYFVIGVELGDATLTSGNSDRVILLGDVNTYDESPDIDGLIKNPVFDLFPYPKVVGVDTGYSSSIQWNEDGFTMGGSFDLDLNMDAFIVSLEFRLIAENSITGKYFEMDSFVFNIASTIVSGGVQQFNLIDTRGYNLETGSQFNEVEITTGSQAAGLQKYDVRFSQKISWQDWIANNLADTVFYDNSKPNDNLNYKSSNYSNGLNDYNIKLSMYSTITGTNSLGVSGITNYHILTAPITVYDYDEDGNVTPVWSATIETFNNANASNLSGAILTGADTLLKITWVNSGGAVTDLTGITAIHRIEETGQNGYNIDEVGTLYGYPSGNRVIPKAGDTNLDMYLDSGNVVTECIIDGTKLNSGIGYNLSGKIEAESVIDPNAKLTSPDNTPKDTSGTIETKVTAP